MNPTLKILLYVICLVCGLAFAYGVKVNLSATPTPSGLLRTNPPQSAMTNSVDATNEVAGTNQIALTNAAATNTVETNLPAETNLATATTAAEAVSDPPARIPTARLGRAVAFGGAAFACLVGLALLLAHDATRMVARRFERFVFNEDLVGVKDPEYEEAEKVWTNGQYLEAVQLLRDYYQRHPGEIYVALRIAEIYEVDLRNYLASALEYEEILKKKLPPDRWGWAAIHLANLYSGKLNRTADAQKLLHRIVEEYGQTGAAKKARERLGIPEPADEDEAEPEQPEPKREPLRVKVTSRDPAASSAETAPAKEEPAKPVLPPGFRPKT